MIKEYVHVAEDNRLKCKFCSGRIAKDTKYFRDAKQGWRASHTVNICRSCIVKMCAIVNVDAGEIDEVRKIMLVEALEDGAR